MEKNERSACGVVGVLFGNVTSLKACLYALLIMRLWLGVTFFAHGAPKLFGWWGGSGFAGVVKMASGLGPIFAAAPTLWAVMVVIAELGGGIALILGIAPRIFAFLIAINMAVAIATVHRADGFMRTFGQQGIMAMCVAIMIAGGGAGALWRARR